MKIDRLIGIVTILLQTEKSTVPALAQRFEVSRRTIERDIDALCRAGVPLVTVQGYGGGVFIEPRYKLDKPLLSGPELAALVAGAAGVGSVSPAPLARSLAEKLGGSGTDDLLIDLSSHYRESLTPKIELLRTAIAEHARVRFTYYYAKGVAEKCAEPYRIVFQWGDWYMFGWCPDAAGWRMYKLNRLTLLSVTAQTFEPRAIPPEALDFNARFHDGTLLRARVAASEYYRLVEEYGPACYTRQPDGSLLLEIGYTNEDVAAAWLLGFGAKAEVLEPPALRARMASEAQALCAVYGAPKK